MKILVTGGGGFLGRYIVEKLLQREDEVSILCRSDYPELREAGVSLIKTDLANSEKVIAACAEQDQIFHVGAKAGYWGKYQEYYQTNVVGTQNILAGCEKHQVKKLIYTSTPSVVFDQKPLQGVDESAPYTEKPLTFYQKTKIEAEKLVLAANGKNGLKTTALRPHLIWGPRDNHIIPRVVARAKAGKLKRIGDGKNKVGHIYVENAAEAHLQAAESENTWGNAYFITQNEPVFLWEWVNQILVGLQIPKLEKSVSLKMALKVGEMFERLYSALPIPGEPPMTRFVALQLAEDHYFDITKAKKDFGYNPKISHDEGMKRLLEYYQSQKS